jgi:glutamate racemase
MLHVSADFKKNAFTFTPMNIGPIGVFDSGFGGLTILEALQQKMPQYDYIYLGDNARSPYGNRSFETVYEYTWECCQFLQKQNCPLIILACNTASAKALRNIQQKHILPFNTDNRILGVIRPTAETIGEYTSSGHIGILATQGTVQSNSYALEITHFAPNAAVYQQACPMLVPLIENNEHQSKGALYFIKKYVAELLNKQPLIDVILLGCTHYPLIKTQLEKIVPNGIKILPQGEIIAHSLDLYLKKHPKMADGITKNGNTTFFTTDSPKDFDEKGTFFYGKKMTSKQIHL